MINRVMFERLYEDIKKHLSRQCKYEPVVTKQPKGTKFPKVVVNLLTNTNVVKDSNGFISHSFIGVEINVFAKVSYIDGQRISEMKVAEDIADECSFVCEDIYGMKRAGYDPTPNIDEDIYRITLRYTATQDDKRNCFF